jgi:hypothetical protein
LTGFSAVDAAGLADLLTVDRRVRRIGRGYSFGFWIRRQ